MSKQQREDHNVTYLRAAYVSLLNITPGRTRNSLQDAMDAIRDELSGLLGQPSEAVQAEHELMTRAHNLNMMASEMEAGLTKVN